MQRIPASTAKMAMPRSRFMLVALTIAVAAHAHAPARAGLYEFDLHLHAEPGITSDMFDSAGDPVSEAPPGSALLPVIADAETSRPAGSQWNFTGTTSGSSLWVLPDNDLGGLLYLGIGAEEIGPADLAGSITLSFLSLSGPTGGVFSMWASTPTNPTPLITSASGFGLPNSVVIGAGDHEHFAYGFTAPGLYAVTFQATGTLAGGGGPVSGVGTFMFGVFDSIMSPYPDDVPSPGPYSFFGTDFANFIYGDGHLDLGIALQSVPTPPTPVVPEPSSVALAGLGVVGTLAAGWRRRRSKRAAARRSAANSAG